jgi:hypothetical protein
MMDKVQKPSLTKPKFEVLNIIVQFVKPQSMETVRKSLLGCAPIPFEDFEEEEKKSMCNR